MHGGQINEGYSPELSGTGFFSSGRSSEPKEVKLNSVLGEITTPEVALIVGMVTIMELQSFSSTDRSRDARGSRAFAARLVYKLQQSAAILEETAAFLEESSQI